MTTIAGIVNSTVDLTAANTPLYIDGKVNPTHAYGTPYGVVGIYGKDLSGSVSLINNGRVYGGYGSGIVANYGEVGGAGGMGIDFTTAGAINNYGTIKGGAGGYGIATGGTGGAGVSLTGTSSLTNRSRTGIYGGSGGYSEGSVAGGGGAAVVLNSGATLANYAHVTGGNGGMTSTGTGGSGGAAVSNAGGGAVTNYAYIHGGAVYLGAPGTVGGVGVYMKGGALTNTVLGSSPFILGGSVESGNGSGGGGVSMKGGTVDNGIGASIGGGSVNTHDTAGTGNGGIGVALTDAAILANAGNVAGGLGTLGNGGAGVTASGAAPVGFFSITNLSGSNEYGHIGGGTSYHGTGGDAVDLGVNTTLLNQNSAPVVGHGGITGGGSNYGTGGIGVDLLTTGAAATNLGSIYGGASGTGTGGAGVELAAGTMVVNSGLIEGGSSRTADGGVGVVLNGGELITSGTITGGSTMQNDNQPVAAVTFGSGPATIAVEAGAKFYGVIANFGVGDTIHVTYLAQSVVQGDFNTSTAVLTLPDAHTLDFTGPAGTSFLFAPDINGGTDITIACYRRGTRIECEHGDVPIERLAIGDRVKTWSDGLQPIRWIGRRTYSAAAADNRAVLPVKLRAGALADGLPRRDLWVSPEHAMFIDGMLIPAAALVNGSSIIQERSVTDVSYLHLELPGHAVIYAEGAPAESFIDDDSRTMFDNAWEQSPGHALEVPTPPIFCAPRVEEGAELEAVRRRIATRARALEGPETAAALL